MNNDDKKVKKDKQDEKEEKQEVKDEGKQEVEELKERIEELENSYKRALADYQNLQKRVTEERGDWLKMANRELLLRFLPIFDTLLLAQKHSPSDELKMIKNLFIATLRSEGITKVEAEGQTFDPMTMDAVDVGEGEDGKVLEEMREGFMIHDKLLRPAQVKVGKKG